MMDAVKYLKERKRMCDSYNNMCDGCGFGDAPQCNHTEDDNPEKAVAIVEKWSAKHPIKTRQSEFLKMFPNAKLDDAECISIFPCNLYEKTKYSEMCDKYGNCNECRKEYWLAEVE